MGRATRWLRSLLGGGKRENRDSKDFTCYGGGGRGGSEDRREKRRWSFGKSSRDAAAGDVVLGQNALTAAAVEAAWVRSFCAERDKEQSKHAIAVAAATAAAADAAVAAAQAAVAVVRLTSQGRGSAATAIAAFGSCRERHMAAVKIQTAFRRYLARKAFRALRALVKLQALVRGYLVRKQAAATLLSMQALIRAQATVRAQRARTPAPSDRKLPLEFRPRRSLETFDETKSETISSFHSRRLSANLDISSNTFDRSPKIVEVDTGRPRSRSSRRTNPSIYDPSDDPHHSCSLSSPLPFQIPARISIPDSDLGCFAGGEKGRLSVTAQSTPRWMNHSCDVVAEEDGALRRFFSCAPSYMAKTQSFEAKSRSHSAPKQRPEAGGGRKRVSLSEVVVEAMAAQRSWCRAPEEAFSFKSAVAGKLDRSSEFYVQRKW